MSRFWFIASLNKSSAEALKNICGPMSLSQFSVQRYMRCTLGNAGLVRLCDASHRLIMNPCLKI